jgi:hypothetical protein
VPFTVAALLPMLPLKGKLLTTPAANTPGCLPISLVSLSVKARRADPSE